MKLKIAHLSDPHFGTLKENVPEALKGILRELEPDLILVSGDITQRARQEQFKAAQEFFESLEPVPILVIPGNHDISLENCLSRLFFPYRNIRHFLKKQLEERILLKGVEVLALNSTSRFRLVQGELQPSRLKKKLAQSAPETKIKVVLFHHPLACPKRVDTKNILRGCDQVVKTLEEYRVDLILSGHIHDPHVSLSSEAYPHVTRASVIAVAGTCLSWRTRADAPNSFNWIEVDPEGAYGPRLCISRYDIQKDEHFRSVFKEEFIRHEDCGWQRANFPTFERFDPGEQSPI